MAIQPVVRWAGGKRWLVPKISSLVADLEINSYHEPFLGGGSVFLGLSLGVKSYLSDLNADLIEMYEVLRDEPHLVADALAIHTNDEQHYYAIRASVPTKKSERAARFIYLNHTSFNGIYRVNLDGKYNVPFGRRPSTNIPSREQLVAVSQTLMGTQLTIGDFSDILASVDEGDLVFLDPPYTAAHNDNGFVKYNQRLFSFDDQVRLKALIGEVRERAAYYIMTNAAHSSIADLFDHGDARYEVWRKNAVGGSGARRGLAAEYLVTNIDSAGLSGLDRLK